VGLFGDRTRERQQGLVKMSLRAFVSSWLCEVQAAGEGGLMALLLARE
jgi:hypothetical protein